MKNNNKRTLSEIVWNKKKAYYDTTTIAYKNIERHFGFRAILPYLSSVHSILEIGCGNGSVLANFKKVYPRTDMHGIDVSKLAIQQGKKLYKKEIHIQVGDAEVVRLKRTFDLVMSFFTFEHLDRPEKVIETMSRHVKKNGYLYIVCPNYGALIYPSPCYTKGIPHRFLFSLRRDIELLIGKPFKYLQWEAVTPILDYSSAHIMDHDTTIEPYIYSLRRFVETQYPQYRVIFADSGWWSLSEASLLYRVATFPIRFLAWLHLPPFLYWGPRCMLLLQRQ
jgi:SAM-dependent methyltransferase